MAHSSRCAAGALTLIATALGAQEPAPRPVQLQADFGLVSTAGNTSTTTINLGENGSYRTGAWTFAQQFSMLYGKTNGKQSAESFMAGLRGDYAFSKRLGMYVMGEWDKNEFAGISRRFREGAGLAFKAVATDWTTVSIEAGFDQTQQRDLAARTMSFSGGRGAVLLKQMLNDKAYIQQLGEVLPNFTHTRDLRVNSETALVAPLSSRIAFKAGYVVHFDKEPEPGFKKTDRYLTSGLQVVF